MDITGLVVGKLNWFGKGWNTFLEHLEVRVGYPQVVVNVRLVCFEGLVVQGGV